MMTSSERLYGNVVVQLVNEEDPYPALLDALTKIQQTFDFSHQFIEKFNGTIPGIVKYEWCDGMQILPAMLTKKELLELKLRKLFASNKSHSKKVSLISIELNKINEWLSVCEANLSKRDYVEITQIPRSVFRSIDDFRSMKKSLRNTLDDIITSKSLQESRRFSSYLRRYNKIIKSLCYFDENGKLVDKPSFDEACLLNMEDPKFMGCLNDLITYSLVEYSRSTEYKNYLKQCSFCSTYFVAKKVRNDQRYCSVCSKKNKKSTEERTEYQRKNRAHHRKQKELQARKARFAAIEKLTEKMNISREEALEIIKYDENV
jgi:hypothetical protein